MFRPNIMLCFWQGCVRVAAAEARDGWSPRGGAGPQLGLPRLRRPRHQRPHHPSGAL